MELEYKQISFECKALEDKQDGYFRVKGKASVYGFEDHGNDIIEAGAFTASLKKIKPILLWGHMMSEPIGVPETIDDNDKSFDFVGKMPTDDDFVLKRVMPQVKVGSVTAFSVGFNTLERVWEDRDGKPSLRRIKKADLYEISLVPFGMNSKAKLTGFKSLTSEAIEEIKTKRDFERLLRDSGASRKMSAYLSSLLDEKKLQSDSGEVRIETIDTALSEMKILNQKIRRLSR